MPEERGHLRALRFLAVMLAAVAPSFASGRAVAEMQVGVYGGMNTNFDSPATLPKGALSDSRTMAWEGRPFQMPPYWG